jgi:hypothetical protein
MTAEPIHWNTLQTVENGKRHHRITARRWVAYRKLTGKWGLLDTTVQPDRTVTKFAADIQFPTTAQGWTELVFNSSFSPKRKLYDRLGANHEPEFLLDVSALTDHNVAGVVGFDGNPNWMGYPNAWDGVDLIYQVDQQAACRLKKLVRIHSEPSGTSKFLSYKFLLRSDQAKIYIGRDRKTRPWDGRPGASSELYHRDAWVARTQKTTDSQIRGTTIETPVCWYTKQNGEVVREDVRVQFSVMQDRVTVVATKFIPRAMVQAAMAEGVPLFADTTFRTDDVGAVGSDHMAAWTGNDTYANVIAANGTEWSDSYMGYQNFFWISSSATANQYDRWNRGFTFFDTSALDGVVTAASLDLKSQGAADNFTIMSAINVYGCSSTGTTSGAASDYQTIETTPFSTEKPWFIPGGYSTWTYNSDGMNAIDVDGFSRFSIGSSTYDYDGADLGLLWAANRDAYQGIYLSEVAGDQGPKLDVTTEPAPPAGGGYRLPGAGFRVGLGL